MTCFALAYQEAQAFYTNELHWFKKSFNHVDWYSLDFARMKKSPLYGVWLAKQASKFCGTILQTSCILQNDDKCCANCLAHQEMASHLNLCPSNEHTIQFKESIQHLTAWMHSHYTHPDLLTWVPHYFLGCGHVLFADLPYNAPAPYCIWQNNKTALGGHISSKAKYQNEFCIS